MTEIKAIETIYKGYRFRSRLEARWGVFFDHLGIEWEYEKEGYDLGEAGWYLPDFWLPKQRCWIEVKGKHPNRDDEEVIKAKALAKHTGNNVYMFFGHFGPVECVFKNPDDMPNVVGSNLYFTPDGDWDGCMSWGLCSICGLNIGLFGSSNSPNSTHPGCIGEADDHAPIILAAYAAARSARFEHGEYPR